MGGWGGYVIINLYILSDVLGYKQAGWGGWVKMGGVGVKERNG